MIEYSEKRDYIRMPMQCPISMRMDQTGLTDSGELRDLSATGMRIYSRQAVDEGARLQVTVTPQNQLTPPLLADVSVIRCEALDQGFEIAAAIDNIEPATYEIED